jgi:hypothetical protein
MGFVEQPNHMERSLMGRTAVSDLVDQYQRTFRMLYEEIGRFGEGQWVKGISDFQVPVRLAMHTVDCLDYYFCGKPGEQYVWGHHFGMLAENDLPSKDTVLTYAHEIEGRVMAELEALTDEDLARPFAIDDGSGATLLGHYIYALRHTIHHQGELAALAVYHGYEGGSWA